MGPRARPSRAPRAPHVPCGRLRSSPSLGDSAVPQPWGTPISDGVCATRGWLCPPRGPRWHRVPGGRRAAVAWGGRWSHSSHHAAALCIENDGVCARVPRFRNRLTRSRGDTGPGPPPPAVPAGAWPCRELSACGLRQVTQCPVGRGRALGTGSPSQDSESALQSPARLGGGEGVPGCRGRRWLRWRAPGPWVSKPLVERGGWWAGLGSAWVTGRQRGVGTPSRGPGRAPTFLASRQAVTLGPVASAQLPLVQISGRLTGTSFPTAQTRVTNHWATLLTLQTSGVYESGPCLFGGGVSDSAWRRGVNPPPSTSQAAGAEGCDGHWAAGEGVPRAGTSTAGGGSEGGCVAPLVTLGPPAGGWRAGA